MAEAKYWHRRIVANTLHFYPLGTEDSSSATEHFCYIIDMIRAVFYHRSLPISWETPQIGSSCKNGRDGWRDNKKDKSVRFLAGP